MEHPGRKLMWQQAGLSLIELMISMVLGLIVTGAVVGVFIAGSRSFAQDEKLSDMQDELRFALNTMTQDVEMAGFWAEILNPANILPDATLSVAPDCGPTASTNWAYANLQAVTGIDNATAAEAEAAYSCIDAGEFEPGTDVISIKRVAGAPLAVAPTNSIYLRSTVDQARLFRGAAPTQAACVPGSGGCRDWEFRPSIYYIRNFSATAGDGIPTLCRKGFEAGGYTTECLAEGVQDLQVEYGIDTNFDGVPDRFLPNDGTVVIDFDTVVAVQLWLLGRSAVVDPNYTNAKTYTISNADPLASADGFYRRVLSTVVLARNPGFLAPLL